MTWATEMQDVRLSMMAYVYICRLQDVAVSLKAHDFCLLSH